MEWFLAALKVIGLVGAYIGLIEPRKERTPSGLRRVAPVAFVVVAICAELYDARIKWKEGVVQAIRYEQLARPINEVAVDVDLTLPYAAISTVAPEYGKRVRRYPGVDVVKDTGSMPLNAQDRDFPRAGIEGESVVRDALDAIYEIDLSFYTGTKDASIANINTLKVRPDFTTPIYGNPTFGKMVGEKGIITEKPATPTLPPTGRQWVFTRSGIEVSDSSATLDLNDLARRRHLHSIRDLKNAKFTLRICPRTGGDEPQLEELHDEEATEVVKLIQQVSVNFYMEGVGDFDVRPSQWQLLDSVPTCKYLYYAFPSRDKDIQRLFGLGSGPD